VAAWEDPTVVLAVALIMVAAAISGLRDRVGFPFSGIPAVQVADPARAAVAIADPTPGILHGK
jgi:hypothetical protein